MISSADIAMPISARHTASVRQLIVSLSTSTPSQSKMISSGCTNLIYQSPSRLGYRDASRSDGFADMRPILRLCLAAVLLLLSDAAPAPHTVLAATPISRMDLPWWRTRHEAKLAELRSHRVDLVFLGDSITQDYEVSGPPEWRDFVPVWQRFYGDRNAINLGFSGDATSHLLWRIENGEVAGITPKVAVILIGANNLGRLHWPAEDTVAGIDAIVAQLRRRLPHTKLLLLGVLPSERSAWATETTLAINKTLAERYHDRDERHLSRHRPGVHEGRQIEPRPVSRPEADAARAAAASIGRGSGADGRGDRANARRATRRHATCGGAVSAIPAPPPATPSHASKTRACWQRGRHCPSPA